MHDLKQSFIIVLIIFLLGFVVLAEDTTKKKNKNPSEEINPLVGHWRMERMSGNDAGDYIAHMEFFFNADGTFKAIATLRNGATDKKAGHFTVQKDTLKMTVGEKTQTPKFEFKEGYLVIKDIQIDAHIWLKKDSGEKSKNKKDPKTWKRKK